MNASEQSSVRRYLVLAHHEGDHEPVLEEARRLLSEGAASFHVLVPATPPPDARWIWSEDDARALARERLHAALEDFASVGARATGEVTDPDQYDAVLDALAQASFDGLIISTLPDGLLERLHLDLLHRIRRDVRVPVTHIVAREAVAAS
jgi:GABA permease